MLFTCSLRLDTSCYTRYTPSLGASLIPHPSLYAPIALHPVLHLILHSSLDILMIYPSLPVGGRMPFLTTSLTPLLASSLTPLSLCLSLISSHSSPRRLVDPQRDGLAFVARGCVIPNPVGPAAGADLRMWWGEEMWAGLGWAELA